MTSVVQKLHSVDCRKRVPLVSATCPPRESPSAHGLGGQTGTERKRGSRGKRYTGRQTQPETFRAQRLQSHYL